MKRVSVNGIVHFDNRKSSLTLCGVAKSGKDLLGETIPIEESNGQVTCGECARLYCEIKNAPWNEVEDKALENGTYDAVK